MKHKPVAPNGWTPIEQDLLRTCGVPKLYASNALRLQLREVLLPFESKRSVVSVSRQTEIAQRLVTPKSGENFLAVFASRTDMRPARTLAACCMHARLKGGIETLPVWHWIENGFEDPLVTRIKVRGGSSTRLVVLDGLADEASSTKLETARRLLSSFEHCPRILLLQSGTPLDFLQDKLAARANAILWFGVPFRRHSI